MYRSSFRVCCSLLLLSFVVSGVMPSLSPRRPAAPASGRSAELLVVLATLKSPWRRMGAGGGATSVFFNKCSCGLLAVGVEPAVLLPLAGRGGEGRRRCCWSSSSAARSWFEGSLSLGCRISCPFHAVVIPVTVTDGMGVGGGGFADRFGAHPHRSCWRSYAARGDAIDGRSSTLR